MPLKPLPSGPNLDHLKNQAKDLLKAWKKRTPEALSRFSEFLPDFKKTDHFSLSDAQFVIAREYGFTSWAKLRAFVLENSNPRKTRPSLVEEFIRAVDAGDVKRTRKLLQQEEVTRIINDPVFSFDSPALVHIAGRGNLKLVELLLEYGADPNRGSDWWAGSFYPLYSASGAVANRLLEAGAVPDACAAAHLDDIKLLRRLLDEDPARVHELGGDGQTPLHFARSHKVIDLLLERGADINARDIDHRSTPAEWMLAGKRNSGRYHLAEYLVNKGASVDVFLATALGLTDKLDELLESKPELLSAHTGQGEYGEKHPGSFHIYTWTIGQNLSPLQVAVQFRQPGALEILRKYATPKVLFLAACEHGNLASAKKILAEHPDIIASLDPEDHRALPDAGWNSNAASVKFMLENGFNPKATQGPGGATILHAAAWQGSLASIEAALAYPEVREIINQKEHTFNSTPLGWCCHGAAYSGNNKSDYPEIARLLLEAGAKPGPNLSDAPEKILTVIREFDNTV